MEYRSVLLFSLLACVIGTAISFRNGLGGPNSIRRIRRISLNEYLVPPPAPKFHPSRTGRLATLQPTEAPGYFAQLMSWFNPFGYGSSSQSSVSPPHPESSYPPPPKLTQQPPPTSVSPARIYSESSPSDYDRPPLPPPVFNNHPEYLASIKSKNCNPCNKVPWVPIPGSEPSHSGDASFIPPPLPQSILNGGYLPSNNHEVAHDAHHAASQEIRAPDFSFVPPLLTAGQDRPLPLPNPHLYFGPMPPLFKATDFNYSPVQTTHSSGSSEYFGAPTLPISGSGGSNYNGGHSIGPSNGELKHFATHGDLSSSDNQASDHANSALDKQGFGNTATHQGSLNSINHQTSFGNFPVPSPQTLGTSNNEGFYGITGPNGPLDGFLDNSSQIARAPSNLGNRYNDLSPSDNVAKDSHTSLLATEGSSTNIKDSIHFEESPLLDLTHKGESLADSSSIPPTSNAFVDFNENTVTAGTTLASDAELFGTRQGSASTGSHFFTDQFQTIDSTGLSEESKVKGSATRNSNRNLQGSKALREQEVPYITAPGQGVEYFWPSIQPTLRSTEKGSFLNTLIKSYDNVGAEESSEDVNSRDTIKQQSAKRNKQVQVIIPYTSQYTPLPFHPRDHGRKVSNTGKSNHDNYASEESRNRIKVVDLSGSTNSFESWPTTLAISESVTREQADSKVNNSIDVHRLQKNIDNWTIQEYSKGTTASTVSPSSANRYLFPSKQIPDEYLTTTESINHMDNPHDDNVKTFALAGFSFNDLEHESSASNRVEESRVQVIQGESTKSTESFADTTVSTKDDITWQSYSVDVSTVNKERVYVVTPQPITTTPKSSLAERKREKAAEETERNSKESTKSSETDVKRTREKSNAFESIEKAYQVLPQAVNNLAVASTGPENVPLWGIMEHEEFASLHNSKRDSEHSEFSKIPVLYDGHSKVSRVKR